MPHRSFNPCTEAPMSTDLADLPIHALAANIKAHRVSPVEIVAACLERIARLDGKLHAFVEVYDKEARLAAEAADKAIRSGHAIGPLHGIPIALKDLVELEGRIRSEEHTSELQSLRHLVCRLLLEKKKART